VGLQKDTVEVGGSRVQLLKKYDEVRDGSATTYVTAPDKSKAKAGVQKDPAADEMSPTPQTVRQIEE